jgi:dipeptidyl-peptidase 4
MPLAPKPPHKKVFMTLASLVFAFSTAVIGADANSPAAEQQILRAAVNPRWLPDGQSFWYKAQTSASTHELVLINARTGERKTAPDLKSLGLPVVDVRTSTLKMEMRSSKHSGLDCSIRFVNTLSAPVNLSWVNQEGKFIPYGSLSAGSEREQPTFAGHVWLVTKDFGDRIAVMEANATDQTVLIDGPGKMQEENKRKATGRGVTSPDGKWAISINKGLVFLREQSSGNTNQLRTELDGRAFFQDDIKWSPDSKAFVVSHCDPVPVRRVTLVESTPKNQQQPKLLDFEYAKPGDALPQPVPVLFRLNDGAFNALKVKTDLFQNAFTQSRQVNVRWSPDSSEFHFDYNQRGHQLYRILAVNAQSGEVRVVVEETSSTFIDYTAKTWRYWIEESRELIWMSERDNWCHLWLYDTKTGQPKNQITKGSWPVREVLHVDVAMREIWFMASGLRAGEDPYHLHLCSVKFDGSDFKQLTEGDGNHRIEFSPTREFFTDTWSRVDHPPVHELRRSADGSLVCVLETAEARALVATGWTMPERFVAKGRDGSTDIYGILIKPANFDPSKKYPVVEDIYAGPHSAFTPKDFGLQLSLHQMADLGFIVVKLDAKGTNHRGKAFHDVCWKNLKDAGFPDRIAWITEAAKTRPWMDLTRVGIYGGSAGGQSAMRALLDHHDFYKVAVADCGCHDNRMDKIWWNEQWMGWPVDDSYLGSSNKEDASKLQGQLLLIVGELDRNVDPASTFQVVGALQKAGKAFEFMPVVDTGHGAAETPYGRKLRADFLVKHLKP